MNTTLTVGGGKSFQGFFLLMKPPCLFALIGGLLAVCASAQIPQAALSALVQSSTIISRGANHRVWEYFTLEADAQGAPVSSRHTFTELQTGLNYLDIDSGEWLPSVEEIELHPQGGVAQHGQLKVIFARNLNVAGAIDMLTPNGQRLRSTPSCLVYYDAATQRSVRFADLQDSEGELLAPNRVLYRDAFKDVITGTALASVRFTYTKLGLEQDVILHQRQPPSPALFNLDLDTVRMEIWTEFQEAPEARRTTRVLKHTPFSPKGVAMAEPDFRNFAHGQSGARDKRASAREPRPCGAACAAGKGHDGSA
jgi:hypothetical protein